MQPPPSPNPKRVAAGRRNQQRRGKLTPAGRLTLRLTALRNRPWRYSTGPRTAKGKAQAIQNGKRRQLGPYSYRETRGIIASITAILHEMREARVTLLDLRK